MKEKNNSRENRDQHYRIGDFVFDSHRGKLHRSEEEIRLEPQVAEFLALLVRNAGVLLDRETIGAAIWPSRVVSDDALRAMVKKLRDALGDDARNPRYIKTLPLKGYVLIATVNALKPAAPANRVRTAIIGALTACGLAATSLLFYTSKGEQGGPSFTINTLTTLPGSEVSPDYNPATRRLLFSHRANKDDFLQLYVKHLDTKRVQRLTWDNADYANAHWSPDGTELVFTRSAAGNLQHFIARFEPDSGIQQPQPLPAEGARDKHLLGWTSSARAIYLKDNYQPESPQGIWRYSRDDHALEQITAPNVKGIGDYFAAESADGQKLAILRALEQDKRELLVLDIATGSLLHTRVLPVPLDRLAWNPSSDQVALSSFGGKLWTYSLTENQFTEIANPSTYINDVFFQCGDDCYYLRRHNGNFLDIQEAPNPFLDQELMPSDTLNLPGAEDFPLYGPDGDGLYFMSKRDGTRLLQFRNPETGVETFTRLPADAPITSLSINPAGTLLAGQLGKRLFILDPKEGKLQFFSSDIDVTGPPTWTRNGNAILYARHQKSRPVLYRYQIDTDTQEVVAEGYIAARELPDRRILAVDNLRAVWLIDGDENRKHIAVLPSEIPNRWQVREGWLYFTEHRGNNAYMVRVNILSGNREKRLLAKNRFRLNFDLHPSSERIVGTNSLLAESDLIQLMLK